MGDSGLDATLLSRVEDAGLNASAPPQQRWLDGWLLRFSPGKAKRARCVNALADGRLPVADKLALARAVLAEAGLPFFVRITPFSQPAGLDALLAGQGMTVLDDTRVMVLAALADHHWVDVALPADWRLARFGHDDYAQLVGRWRESPPQQQRAHAQRLAQSPVPYAGYGLYAADEADPVACAQVAREGALVGLYDVFTAPQRRNQGLSRRLCALLLGLARREGARTAYLQVDAANAPARAVYARLGFVDGYGYHYRADSADAQ